MTLRRFNSLPVWLEPLAVALLGLLVRIAFIHLHPAIYGGDTLARIMNADRILLAYQLPLLQLLIYLVNRISADPLLIRYLMSLIGALAGVAFYFLSATLFDRPTARLASVFFIFNPFLIVHSIVPYQEVLMLLTLCLGLCFLLAPRPRVAVSSQSTIPPRNTVPGWTGGDPREVQDTQNLAPSPSLSSEGERQFPYSIGWASFFLGLACLTRYEAWLITGTAGLYYIRLQLNGRSLGGSLRLLGRTILLFGWAPALWIVLHRGLSPSGTYVLESLATWARLWRVPYVTAMTLYHSGPVVGLLGFFGLLTFWKESLWRKREIQLLLIATLLFLLSLVLSAHGMAPDPERYVTDREAHWFILFPFWAAALALSNIKNRLMPHRGASHSKSQTTSWNLGIAAYSLVLILGMTWGLLKTDRYLNRLLKDQNLVLDYEVAKHLEKNLPANSMAVIFAKPLPPDATKDYLDKVYSQGGTTALQAARRRLLEINAGSLDYSRVVVNTRIEKSRILDANKLTAKASDIQGFFSQNQVRLAAIFSDYSAQDLNSLDLLNFVRQQGKLQTTLAGGRLQVSIYRVQF